MHVINIESGHGKHSIKVSYPLLGGFLNLKSISKQKSLGFALRQHLHLVGTCICASLALGEQDNITEEVENVSHFGHKAR